MRVVLLPIGQIRPYPGNPRINDSAVEAVAKSLEQFGFRQPIVVDQRMVIICGHTRWKAAKKLGLPRVPVHVAKDLTAQQVKAYRLADNKTAELAEWDMKLLPVELKDLQAADYDLAALGFGAEELQQLLDAGLSDPDAVPAPPDEPITRPGDVWLLNKHELLCGDGTGPARAQERAVLFLDPPFELEHAAPDRIVALMERHDGPVILLSSLGIVAERGQAFPRKLRTIVAIKASTPNVFGVPKGLPCFRCYIARIYLDRAERFRWRRWNDDFMDDCWEEHRSGELSRQVAPYSKAVNVGADLLKGFSLGAIRDPFAGGGTTLICAEMLARTWTGAEINPAMCDVIIERWQRFTGGKAVRAENPQPPRQPPSKDRPSRSSHSCGLSAAAGRRAEMPSNRSRRRGPDD